MVFLLALFLVVSVLAKRLAGKSVSDMTYIVSSGTLNLNSINQSINQSLYVVCLKWLLSLLLAVFWPRVGPGQSALILRFIPRSSVCLCML